MSGIKAGDLVMIIKLKPCCRNGALGKMGTVGSVARDKFTCTHCGTIHFDEVANIGGNNWIPTWRLQKIDPPALDEAVDRKVEVPA